MLNYKVAFLYEGVNSDCSTDGEAKAEILWEKLLWKIFGPEGNEVTSVWRGMHSDHLYENCVFSSITLLIKSRISHGLTLWQVWGKERWIRGFGGET